MFSMIKFGLIFLGLGVCFVGVGMSRDWLYVLTPYNTSKIEEGYVSAGITTSRISAGIVIAPWKMKADFSNLFQFAPTIVCHTENKKD